MSESNKPLLSEQEQEMLCIVEEAGIKDAATSMIKMHKRLLQMHYGLKNDSWQKKSSKKKEPRLPLSIDPAALEKQLHHAFDTDKVFLREMLSINTLAYEIGVEPHNLSRFLKIHLHTTFNELLNRHRVNEAKTLLISEPESSILDIAYAAGFNSKASFNRIFKKTTGTTPMLYRRMHAEG